MFARMVGCFVSVVQTVRSSPANMIFLRVASKREVSKELDICSPVDTRRLTQKVGTSMMLSS